MLTPYRDILRTPGALAFSSAGVLARLPMSMVGLGIVLMISILYSTGDGGNYAMASRVMSAHIIAVAVCAPQVSKLVDRYGQARVMLPALLTASGSLAALVVLASVHSAEIWLYIPAVLSGATIGSVGSLVRARWSHVLDEPDQLHTAYSLESVLDEAVFIVGPVLVTVLATAVAPQAGMIVAVVALSVGGVIFLTRRETEPPATGAATVRGRSPVLQYPTVAVVVVIFIAVGMIFGATDVATVAFAEEQGRPSAAGVVLAVFAAGSFVAGIGYGARQWASPLWRRFGIGVILLAVGVCLFLTVTSIPMLAAIMFVVGFAIAPTLITGNGLIHATVPAGRLTESLTWALTALTVGVAVGAPIAGQRIDDAGAHAGFVVVVVAAGVAFAAALGGLSVLRRQARANVTVVDVAQPGVEHLVVMGPSGVGKTTVATALAAQLGRPFAEGDEFHPPANVAKMAAGVPLTDADREPWLAAVRDWMAEQAAAGTSTVLTCSALRRTYRDVLRSAPGHVHFVQLDVDPELVRARMAARTDHYMPAALLDSQIATLEPLEADEDGVVVAVDGAPEQVVRTVTERLG